MKKFFLLSFLFFNGFVFAQDVPPGCPTNDVGLIAAVNSGQRIVCQIKYFTGGKGGRWVKRPIYPNAQASIESACVDAQMQACPGIALCYESPYFECTPEKL